MIIKVIFIIVVYITNFIDIHRYFFIILAVCGISVDIFPPEEFPNFGDWRDSDLNTNTGMCIVIYIAQQSIAQ